jgi:hypothetical protein
MKHAFAFAFALLALSSAPAAAGAGSFMLVNGAGAALKDMSIRRFGTDQWQRLAASPSPGARQSVSFTDPDCAFDIRATLDGDGAIVWSGVNLCEVKIVTLNRSPSGELWVDYE